MLWKFGISHFVISKYVLLDVQHVPFCSYYLADISTPNMFIHCLSSSFFSHNILMISLFTAFSSRSHCKSPPVPPHAQKFLLDLLSSPQRAFSPLALA
jgi:hypothetical protein